jgi:hypothetical protein
LHHIHLPAACNRITASSVGSNYVGILSFQFIPQTLAAHVVQHKSLAQQVVRQGV